MIVTNSLRIIAGPDSLDEYNIDECYQIADIKVDGANAIYGIRTVGLKSRTGFDAVNSDAGFMGYDFHAIMENFNIFGHGGNRDDLVQLPTVTLAKKLWLSTGVQCATEVMLPAIQLACIAREFENKPFMIWNSAVDQLGWHVRQMAGFANEYGWTVGLKNGKWLGEHYEVAESEDLTIKTSIETVWDGLVNYSKLAPETVLIQRGCDLPDSGDHRNLPIHNTAMRTKLRNKGIKLFFDPSHTFGPLLRDEIVNQTVKAMQLMMPDQKEYLYDGVLIEVGTAKCDRHQHITVEELDELCQILSCFRVIEKEVKSLPASYDHALDLHKNR
jgi:hypothetical protein